MDALIRKTKAFCDLLPEEAAFLQAMQTPPRRIAAGATMIQEGKTYQDIYLLNNGWAARNKHLSDGRRQVVNFVLPGDFIGIRANLLEVADDTVVALTECAVATFSYEQLYDLCRKFPRLALVVLWSSAREQSILSEHIVRLGRRSALERMAHLFMELLRRLQLVGEAGRTSFDLPLTQELIADALGLSIVHVNRTLSELRQRGLVEIDKGRLTIRDIDRLATIGEFSRVYLDQE